LITQKTSMKKLIFVLIFFLFTILSKAQDFGVSLGAKVGYQTTKLSAARVDIDADLSEHMLIDGFGRIVISNFIIQPEIMLFKTSQIFDLTGTDATHLNISVEAKQKKLAFPMMCGYQIFERPLFKVRAMGGLVMYYLVDETNQNTYNNQSLDIQANKQSWGGIMDIGVDVLMFTFDFSYSFGMSNIFEREFLEIGGQYYIMENSRQNFFTLTVGIKLFNYEYNHK